MAKLYQDLDQTPAVKMRAKVVPMSSIVKFLLLVGGSLALIAISRIPGKDRRSSLRESNAYSRDTSEASYFSEQVTRAKAELNQVTGPIGISKGEGNIKGEKIEKVAPAVTQPKPAPIPVQMNCAAPPYVILGQPTSNSISLRFLSDYATTIFVSWALEGGAGSPKKTDLFKLVPSEPSSLITLTNLELSTRYVYQVWFQNSFDCDVYATENFFFHTQRYFDEDFTFAVIADTHFEDPGAYEEDIFFSTRAHMIKAAHSSPGFDFFVDLGDTFMGNKFEPPSNIAFQLYENAFKQYSPIARSAPIFLVNGNHDGELGAFIPKSTKGASLSEIEASFPVVYARLRNKYFVNPKSGGFFSANTEITYPSVGELRNYYSWSWGNSLFVVLDPYWYTLTHVTESPWEWTLGKTQYMWLASILQNMPATLKFVFIHQYAGGVYGTSRGYDGGGDESFAQYFEWGGKDPMTGLDGFATNRPGWNHGPIHQMFTRYRVSVVFRGHDHLFHVGELDGVIYNTLPKPSVGDHGNAVSSFTERGYKDDQVSMTSGHTEVQVTKLGATVTLRSSSENSILHQYTVSAAPYPM